MSSRQRSGRPRPQQQRPQAPRQQQGRPAQPGQRGERSIGTFTSAREAGYRPPPNPLAGLTFGLDGETFRCQGELDLLDQGELAMLSMSPMDTRDAAGLAMMVQFLQLAFGYEEYTRFHMHVRARKTPPETQLEILSGISEAVGLWTREETGRPTMRPSSSSPGPRETDERVARVISLQTGEVQVIDPEAQEAQTR
jgi:hypothetical protein